MPACCAQLRDIKIEMPGYPATLPGMEPQQRKNLAVGIIPIRKIFYIRM